jgi:hypothetical protein
MRYSAYTIAAEESDTSTMPDTEPPLRPVLLAQHGQPQQELVHQEEEGEHVVRILFEGGVGRLHATARKRYQHHVKHGEVFGGKLDHHHQAGYRQPAQRLERSPVVVVILPSEGFSAKDPF